MNTPLPKPSQIKLKLANKAAWDKLLACQGKLKKTQDESSVLMINEEHPNDYRRRKTMLRELVKFINKGGKQLASIESGGLKLRSEFYRPDQLDNLDPEYHPRMFRLLKLPTT